MNYISKEKIIKLRKEYPVGTRVELVKMNDYYDSSLKPGEIGKVLIVDDIGTIHIRWNNGSRLGVVYGEDKCIVRKECTAHDYT